MVMKKKRSFRLFSMILALAMMCGIMAEGFSAPPAAAAANNAGTSYAPVTTGDPTNVGGVTVEKSAQAVSSQEYNAGTENEFWVQFDVTGQDDTTEPTPVDVILVLDESSSMQDGNGWYGEQRETALRAAAKRFANRLLTDKGVSEENRVAAVVFADEADKVGWGSKYETKSSGFMDNSREIQDWIDHNYDADGGQNTNQSDGLEKAYEMLTEPSTASNGHKKIVVLFTDGAPAPSGDSLSYQYSVNAQNSADKVKTVSELYCVYWEPDDSFSEKVSVPDQYVDTENSWTEGGWRPTTYYYDTVFGFPYITKSGWNYYIETSSQQKSFVTDYVLPTLATDASHLYKAEQNEEGLNQIFDGILGQIAAYATDLTINDVISDSFTFNAGVANAVQWRYGEGDWNTMGTMAGTDAPYYSVDGQNVSLHFNSVSSQSGPLQVRFQVTLNSGKVSTGTDASFEKPDLDTNASASISFTDAAGKEYSNEAINQYPKVYIPSQTLTIKKQVAGADSGDTEFSFSVGATGQENQTVTLKNGGAQTMSYRLRPGASYSVSEDLSNSTYHLDSITKNGEAVQIADGNTYAGTIELGKDVALVFTNKDKSDSLHLDKTAELLNWNDRTYKINLSARADGTTTSTSVPADIVLVLDDSGSMGFDEELVVASSFEELKQLDTSGDYYKKGTDWQGDKEISYKKGKWYIEGQNWQSIEITEENFNSQVGTVYQRTTRLAILKEAVTEFVNSLPQGSTVAIERFFGSVYGSTPYGDRVCDNTKITDESSRQSIINTLNQLQASGGTYMYKGLELAEEDLTEGSTNQVVIVFSDGEESHSSNESEATTIAARIKQAGAKVFTVGVGTADDDFLQKVCSSPSNEYYQKCDDMKDLAGALEKISQSTTGGFTNATVTDVIDPAFIVTDAQGKPLQDGATVGEDGILHISPDGTQYVEWKNQEIRYDKDNPNQPTWSKTIYIKAKEEFIGGNDITTNGPDSGISVDGIDKKFPQPEVNVKVRFDVTNDTDTIFKGEPIPGTTLVVPYTTDSEHNIITGDDMYCGHTDIGTFTYSWDKGTDSQTGEFLGGAVIDADETYTLTVTFTPKAAEPNNTNNKVTTESKKEAAATTETGTYTVKVVPGELQITKTIDGEFYEGKGDIKQSFVFKVERYDSAEAYDNGSGTPTDTFYEVITVDASNAEQAKDGITKTVTGLSKGYYVVTEQEGDAWRYDQESMTDNWENNDGYVAIGTKTSEEPLAYYGAGENTAGVQENPATVDVTNKLTDKKWLSDTTVAVNTITNGSEA